MSKIYRTESSEATENAGRELAELLEKTGIKRAFIALFGEVGVGKTVFTRGFASHFGTLGIKSPTYTIVNEHRQGKANIYHFDLYRINGDDDLYSIGFDEYLERDGYCISEWSERLGDELPEDAVRVTISKTQNATDERIIEITCPKEYR